MTPLPSTRLRNRLLNQVKLLLDIGLAPAVYFVLKLCGVATVPGLVVASVLAGVLMLGHVVWSRRLDGLTAFLLGTYVASLALALVAANPQFVLARDPIISGLTGLGFGVTCLAGRPAMFVLAARGMPSPAARQNWSRWWEVSESFRRAYRTTTVVWSAVLVLEAVARLVVIGRCPIDTAATASPVIELTIVAVTLLWTTWYRRHTGARRYATTEAPPTPVPTVAAEARAAVAASGR